MERKNKLASKEEQEIFTSLLSYYNLLPEHGEATQYKVICPFHNDKNASLGINIPQAYFYCYAGCGAQGTSIDLYKAFYKLNNPNKREPSDLQCLLAIKNLAKSTQEKRAIYTSYISYIDPKNNFLLLREAKDFYFNLPTPNWYRPSRVEAIEEETRECKLYMKKRGFTPNALNLIGAKPSLNKNYPIIFPLLENGIFRGYVMRTFDKEVEEQRKYLYNKGFRRANCLPGKYKGRKEILLVEGYLDLLKAFQVGIKSAASILGWKLSGNQIEKIKKAGIKKIICGTDMDEAGEKGYRYIKRIAKELGWKVERLEYPKGIKDFGDINRGTKELEQINKQLSEYKIW